MSHAIVEQMEPSDEQRPAITARGSDLLVTAGAGSGKTRTLVARYLDLLAEGLPLRSLVAVTFTRKAAREMRSRVRLQVQRYLARPELDAEQASGERQHWLQVYAALDAARIGTIHSLCSEFLRAHPAEAGVDPRFDVLDEGQTSLLRQQAVDEALAWAADAPEARDLYDLLGEKNLRDVVADMLNKRLEVEPAFASGASSWLKWQALLFAPLLAFVDGAEVRDAFDDLTALRHSNTWARAQAEGDDLAPILEDLCEAWHLLCAARASEDWDAASGWFSSLDGLLKQKGRQKNWAPANPKETIRALRGFYDAVPIWLREGDLALDRRLAEAMPALAGLYDRVIAAYRQLREERNALDFDDLEERAVDLLQGHGEVLARWQEDIKAILVDEFQDTNRRQLQLVELLNGGRGCSTYVGDAKQSIYGFRGAEVSVFRGLQQRCREPEESSAARIVGRSLRLSYRAHRDLVVGLNELLRPALGEQAEEDLEAYRHEAAPGWASPYIELHLTVGTKGEGKALARAASALAARLQELVASGRMVCEGDALRPLGYGDMAILCRASRSFAAYEDALDSAGVPFTTVAGRGFYQRPEVRDLLNALRAIGEPRDDLAVAGFLRSPVVGLTDATLYALCRAAEPNGSGSTGLWCTLQGPLAMIQGAERARVLRAAALIADLHPRVGRAPVADLLKMLIDKTDYKAALRRARQGRALRNVDKLLADAHASAMVSVGEFLEYVTLLRDAGAREGEARATGEGAVQIMTVHAAKGLEFPVVALGDVTSSQAAHPRLLVDRDLGVVLPLQAKEAPHADESGAKPAGRRLEPRRGKSPVAYLCAQEREKAAEREESARLLYVAATRAREMLLVSGCVRLGKDQCPSGLGEWLGWLAEPLHLCDQPVAYDEAGHRVLHLALQAQVPVSCRIYEPDCAWEPIIASEPETDAPPPAGAGLLDPLLYSPEETVKPEGEDDLGPRVWRVVPEAGRVHAPQWVVGALVHEALSTWRFPDARYPLWAEAHARTLGLVDQRLLRDAAGRSAALLRRFKSHALYREMDGAAERFAEVPYSRRSEDGRTDNGVIDALYRYGEQWTIVEFKTDHVRNEAGAAKAKQKGRYDEQADRYIHAVKDLVGQEPRHVFCWLDYAGTVHCDPPVGP